MFELDAKGAQIKHAAFNSKMVGFLSLEVFASALAAGLYRQSLATGLIVFAGLYLLFSLETMKHALAVFFSLFWGALVFGLTRAMGPDEQASWILAGVVSIASFGLHIRFFRWQNDLD